MTVSVGGSGTASSGTDYAAVTNFDVTIAAGQGSGTAAFTLTPAQDTLVEGNETVGVAGSVTGLTVNGTTLTLNDDDGAPAVNLSLSPSSVGEGDGATQVTVTAEFSNSSTYLSDTAVSVSVGSSGSAASGIDYVAVSDFTVTIAAGQRSATGTFTLTPTQDTVVEGNETIIVTGSVTTGLTVNATTLTLTDDDSAPSVSLSLSPSSVGEGDGATQVAVTAAFSGDSIYATPTAVTVAVGGSGRGTADSGADYAAAPDFTLTIAAYAKSGTGTFTFTPVDDTLAEGNETVGVSGTATGLTVYGANLTLTEDDGAPGVNLSLSPSSVGEGGRRHAGDGDGRILQQQHLPDTDRAVTVSVGSSGTAAAGADYAAVPDFEVTIAANTSSGTGAFTLTPKDDSVVEGNETVGVSGTTASLAVSGADLTLTDDVQRCGVGERRQRPGGQHPDLYRLLERGCRGWVHPARRPAQRDHQRASVRSPTATRTWSFPGLPARRGPSRWRPWMTAKWKATSVSPCTSPCWAAQAVVSRSVVRRSRAVRRWRQGPARRASSSTTIRRLG